MKSKLLILLLVIFTLAIGFISLKNVSSKSKQERLKELENAEDKNSLAWHVRRAKITGDRQVTLPLSQGIPAIFKNLNDALSHFRVIVGEPIEKYTEASTWTLVTWYKFKIIEDLSQNSLKKCSSCDDSLNEPATLPDALLSLQEDEILVPKGGGMLVLDGIKLVQPSQIPVDFSDGSISVATPDKTEIDRAKETPSQSYYRLSNSKRFLLFLKPSKSGKVGILPFIERGIFVLDPEGELKPIGEQPDYIKSQLQELQINSINKLKEYTHSIKLLNR